MYYTHICRYTHTDLSSGADEFMKQVRAMNIGTIISGRVHHCVCECVCVRERETETERERQSERVRE